jgi:hypothetical protein
MITPHFAYKFTEEWIGAWNSHNLENILSHYTEDFSIESPLALKRLPETKGLVSGKPAVAAYWKLGLEMIPDLFFEVYEVLIGVNGITIYYINHATQRKTAEVMFINEAGKVYKAFAFYTE